MNNKIHPNSPKIGDIIECTDKSRKLFDPEGYIVEYLGYIDGYGTPYGYFAARGVLYGCLYQISVMEWKIKK